MPASLDHIHPGTPMGANLTAGGATFRVWAPNAHAVYVIGDFNDRERTDASLLNRDQHGHWRGFIPGVRDRQRYMFYVVGEGGEGPKRDPYARELQTPFPGDCVIRKTDFPWHDTGYATPLFRWLPLRSGERHRSRRRATRLELLPGSHLHAAIPSAERLA